MAHSIVLYSNGKQIDRIPLNDVREIAVYKDSEDLIVIVVELKNNTRTYGETIRFE